MAESMGETPENRRYSDPFSPMSAAIAEPISYAQGNNDSDPHPQIHFGYESSTGTPCPSRPERARANDARYGATSQSETANPVIPDPCREGHTPASGGSAEVCPPVNTKWYER